jgi:hypothetical protein
MFSRIFERTHELLRSHFGLPSTSYNYATDVIGLDRRPVYDSSRVLKV